MRFTVIKTMAEDPKPLDSRIQYLKLSVPTKVLAGVYVTVLSELRTTDPVPLLGLVRVRLPLCAFALWIVKWQDF